MSNCKNAILWLLLLTSCQGCPPTPPAKPAKQVFVVLCDLSGSTHDTSVQDNILGHVKEIVKRTPMNSVIHFVSIEDRDYNSTLFTLRKELPEVLKPSEQRILESLYENVMPDSIAGVIQRQFQADYKKTCITHAMIRAHEHFEDELFADSSAICKLVILSDMVEECPSSVLGPLDLRYDLSIGKMRNPINVPISSIRSDLQRQGVSVFMIFESKNLLFKELPRWELEKQWCVILQAFGYKDRSSIVFSVEELPINRMFNHSAENHGAAH